MFHKELHSGNLKTKLSTNKVKDVIKQMDQHFFKKQLPKTEWKKSVQKQTKMFHTKEYLESMLTVQNLNMHNIKLNDKNKCLNIEELLERKMRDLELCKGIDEPSLGRASLISSKHDPKPDINCSHRMKKMMMMKSQNKVSSDVKSIIEATKMVLEKNAHIKLSGPEICDDKHKDAHETEKNIPIGIEDEKMQDDESDGQYKRIAKSRSKCKYLFGM